MSRMITGGGPCKIEVTLENGEKFTYNNAVLISQDMSIQSEPIHILGRYTVQDHVISSTREVTLKFIDRPTPEPVRPKTLKDLKNDEIRKSKSPLRW